MKEINTSNEKTTQIAIFASGTGSNAARLMAHFARHATIKIALVVCNKPTAPVLQHADAFGVPSLLVTAAEWQNPEIILKKLQASAIDFIVLAGFLWRIPPALVDAFSQRMINLHPSLLPKYGGKGMYGMRVHEAVVAARETETGITIHYVNEAYDEGAVLAQYRCPVAPADTAEIVSAKIHALEMEFFPKVVENLLV